MKDIKFFEQAAKEAVVELHLEGVTHGYLCINTDSPNFANDFSFAVILFYFAQKYEEYFKSTYFCAII